MRGELDRRSFLRGGLRGAAALGAGGMLTGLSALAGASASARVTGASDRAPRPPQDGAFRKAVKLGMVGDGDSVLEKFRLVKALGFDGIEPARPSDVPLEDLAEAAERTGLVVHGVVDSAHWGKPFSHPDPAMRADGLAALQSALRDAHALGADTVLVVPGVVSKEVSYAEAWDRSRAEIATVLPLAQELGVRIAFENVWNAFLLSPLEFARYVDSFESEWVGAYFDVGNVVRYGWPEHWIEALGPRILKIDVKEYSRTKQREEGLWKGFDVALHEGDCDWPAVMAALREIGYAGWFTAEVPGGGRERLERIAADMDRIFAA